MKKCSKCNKEKELDEFNKQEGNKDGLFTFCKECHYNSQIDYQKKYAKTDKCKDYRNKYQKDYRNREEGGVKARCLCRRETVRLIKNGELKRQPCEKEGCKEEKVDSHHEDYTKPKDVTWLCEKHHQELHRKKKEYSCPHCLGLNQIQKEVEWKTSTTEDCKENHLFI